MTGCNNASLAGDSEKPVLEVDTLVQKTESPIEIKFKSAGLINIQDLIPAIIVDLKYSTTDNFLKTDVYGDLTSAYLQPDVVEKLKKAYACLQEKDISLTFVIYDAARPVSVQQKMWDILKLPIKEKGKYLSSPTKGSVHNYGAAIDMSIIKKNGTTIDMGTPFDYFGDLAEPQLEYRMLSEGRLTEEQINNRKILREVMQKAGFRQMSTEWWHYNSCSREEARIKYKIIN